MIYNLKHIRILSWLKTYPVEKVLQLMKKDMHLLDDQIIYNLEILKEKKLIKYTNYKYSITYRGKLLLFFYNFRNKFFLKPKENYNINQDFFESYLPNNEKMLK